MTKREKSSLYVMKVGFKLFLLSIVGMIVAGILGFFLGMVGSAIPVLLGQALVGWAVYQIIEFVVGIIVLGWLIVKKKGWLFNDSWLGGWNKK